MKQISTTVIRLLLFLFPALALAQEGAAPVEFIENRGQWEARARFSAQVGIGARLFAEAKGLTYTLTAGLPDHHSPAGGELPKLAFATGQVPAHALRVEFVGSNAAAVPVGERAAPGLRHFLHGAESARWAAGARSWKQLRYPKLWPGTDLVLKANDARQLEYDLELAPGADARHVRLRYHGAMSLWLDPDTGHLQVKTSVGQLTEQRPRAWQLDAAGRPQPVACAFRLRGTELGFELGQYDHGRPLVIDPVVQFASYTGSTVENWGFAATHDAAGNLYTAGVAFDPGYPTTTGAFQVSFNGSIDIAIMKFATRVSGPGARLWATYLGGSGLEFPHSLLVNSRGELLLLGSTSSANYPTTAGALSRSFQGGPSVSPYGTGSLFVMSTGADLVLTRLSASGGSLDASTYLGGSNTDGVLDPLAPAPRLRHNYGDAFRGDLALDPQGNVYLASVSSSADFPGLVPGAFQGGSSDGVVACLDTSLSSVRWATPVGGSGADAAYSLQREEPAGTVLVAGGTTSSNLSGAAGGFQPFLGGEVDGFVARLSDAGAVLQSTYLGTPQFDQAYFVRLGPGGKPCVLGQSLGSYRTTAGTYTNTGGRQFIQQLQPSLQAAGFATVFGSGRATTDISPTAFDIDCYGRLFLAGWGGGLDPNNGSTMGLPTTANALQSRTDGQDFYLMQLSDGAQALDYASFFGTSADDHVDGGSSRFDALGTLYQAVCACNQGGAGIPIPSGANYYSAVNGSAHCNNAAFKFAYGPGSNPAGADSLVVCARAGNVRLGGSPAGGTWTGPGVSGNPVSGYFFVPDTLRLGWHQLTYTSPPGACGGTSIRHINVVPQQRARISAPQTQFCLQTTGPAPALVPLTGTPAGGVFTGAGVAPGSSFFDPVLAGPGNHTIRYELPGGPCPAAAALVMRIKGLRVLNIDTAMTVCLNNPPVGLVSSPPGGVWTGPGVRGSTGQGYTFNPLIAGVGIHWLTYTLPGDADCPGATGRMRVIVRGVAGTAQAPADTALCFSGRPFRLTGGLPAGGRWVGAGVSGTLATGFVFTPSALVVGSNSLAYIGPVTNPNECPPVAYRTVNVTSPMVSLSAPASLFCPQDGPQPLTAVPDGGVWSGPGVSGSAATGYTFSPRLAGPGRSILSYSAPPPTNPAQCAASGRLELDVLVTPPVTIAAVPPIGICASSPPHGIVLTAQPPGGTFGGAGVIGNRFNAVAMGPGRHVVTYSYREPQLGCLIEASQTIEVFQLSPVRLPADTVLCAGQGPFRLRASPAGGAWTGPGVTATGLFTPSTMPGTTVLTYSLPDGCGSQTYRITVPPEPPLEVQWTATGCVDNHRAPRTLRFTASGPVADGVQWDFGDGSAPQTGAVVEHAYTGTGRFVPRAIRPGASSGLCPAQIALPALEVQEAIVPNVFTPNADGKNDTFAPQVGGCPGRLQVFSRWGQQVYSQENYQGEWGGTGLSAGLYYFLLSPAGGASAVKGWVEIVR